MTPVTSLTHSYLPPLLCSAIGFFFEEWLKVEILKQDELRKEKKKAKEERRKLREEKRKKRREEEEKQVSPPSLPLPGVPRSLRCPRVHC
jgi:hypothetical protein